MTQDLPVEVKEAINLFKEFEKPGSHKKKARSFEAAVHILDIYIEDNPNSPHLAFIEKIKTSYTRALLRQLIDIGEIEIEDWSDYFVIIALRVNNEAERILLEDSVLMEGYEDFKATWRDEAIRALKKSLEEM